MRPTATIVVPAWNVWERTRECLDALLATVSSRDQIVVVDNGSRDATASELAPCAEFDVITNAHNRGIASACNQGAQRARGEVVIFLHNDTVVTPGWLDVLLAPFEDPTVAASGPVSNHAKGAQRLDTHGRVSGDRGATLFSNVDALDGFCLAVCTEVFNEVGGFDEYYVMGGFEDDDLCRKITQTGRKLVIAHGAYVSHVGRATFDANGVDWWRYQRENGQRFREKWTLDALDASCLVSVCLIVKNEEQMLEGCLESVAELADEIVVYDTGSTDRTVEIARAAGARVFEGYWDNSFARARNTALAQARGEWILSLDADEIFLAHASSVRATLGTQPDDVDAFLVPIENLHGAGNARSVHTAVRLFRRTRATWRHRLHEQVVAADDLGRALLISYLSCGRIIHSGYVAEIFESRDKAERNLELARAALDDDDVSREYALMNYGRALESAGHSDEAVDSLLDAIAIATDPITHRLAIKNLIYILQRLARFDEALEQIGELRRISINQIVVDIAEGNTRIAMGDVEAGLALLARVPPRGRDDDGMEYSAHTLAALRGEALSTLGRFSEAADVVLDAIRASGVLEADVGELTTWLAKSGRSPSEIAQVMEEADLMPMLGRVVRQTPDVADAVLEGIWGKFPDHAEPLAAAARLAPRLPIARALVWSSRLRARGLGTSCPLVVMTNDADADPVLRLLAAAAAFGTFGERRVIRGALEAREKLELDVRIETLAAVTRVAPALFDECPDDEVVVDEIPLTTSTTTTPRTSSRIERGRRASVAPTLAVATRITRGGINVIAPFESSDRHGHVARAIVEALGGANFPVSTTSYHAGGRAGVVEWRHRDAGDLPFDTSLLVMSPEDLANFAIDMGATPFEERYAIGVWPWDLEQPSEMMAIAARMVHEIWVPSAFTSRAVSRVTDRPVANVRVPLDAAENQSMKRDPGFTFLTGIDYQIGFERQNPLGVVAAYRRAFGINEGSRLVIEVAHQNDFPSEHAQLLAEIDGRDDISFVAPREGVNGRELLGRTRDATCFVSLHRSEGTGLGLTRAMVLGIPIIATRHSLATELLNDQDAILVPALREPIPVEGRWCAPGGYWAAPDLDAAVEAMRRVATSPLLDVLNTRRLRDRAVHMYAPSSWSRSIRDRLADLERRRYGAGHSKRR